MRILKIKILENRAYTPKNAQVVTGLQTSCVRTACSHVVATSMEQPVNN